MAEAKEIRVVVGIDDEAREELRALIREELEQLVRAAQQPPRLIDEKEAANFLGVGMRTLQRWRQERYVPFVRLGGRCFYRVSELQEWIQENSYEPVVIRRPFHRRAKGATGAGR